MKQALVKNYMTSNPLIIRPDISVGGGCGAGMKEADCGVFPIGTLNKPVGIITDRDIVLRVIAKKICGNNQGQRRDDYQGVFSA